jgi:mannose-6-phosphate isomerase-like protein (cupin superfamily)
MRTLAQRLVHSVIGGFVAWVAVGAPAFAQAPAANELKTQIKRWDDAPSHAADWGEMRRYFTGQSSATKDVLVAVAVVQPGKSVHKAHRHAEEEYLALVEGTGTWSVDGKESPAQRGDILYAAPWVYHGLTNTGDKPLIFLVVRYNGKGVAPPPQPDNRPNELADQTDAAGK